MYFYVYMFAIFSVTNLTIGDSYFQVKVGMDYMEIPPEKEIFTSGGTWQHAQGVKQLH